MVRVCVGGHGGGRALIRDGGGGGNAEEALFQGSKRVTSKEQYRTVCFETLLLTSINM